jgi:hypothetical protein
MAEVAEGRPWLMPLAMTLGLTIIGWVWVAAKRDAAIETVTADVHRLEERVNRLDEFRESVVNIANERSTQMQLVQDRLAHILSMLQDRPPETHLSSPRRP